MTYIKYEVTYNGTNHEKKIFQIIVNNIEVKYNSIIFYKDSEIIAIYPSSSIIVEKL